CLVIQALEQTGGYGRHNRAWEGGAGNLYFSFLLQPRAALSRCVTLSLVAGIALVRALQHITHQREGVVLKWPNDVMLGGLKCAGILLENVPSARQSGEVQNIVIGIGVNIASAPGEGTACVLDFIGHGPLGRAVSCEALLDRFLSLFGEAYSKWNIDGFSHLKSDFLDLTYPVGTHMSVKLPTGAVQGQFQGIEADGSLIILCKDRKELQKITTGDVFLV
ncbi:MAG: biotin--[acetyl-CoA-carboxylase] ligase, partial [Alphaproteobacteria bacterium]